MSLQQLFLKEFTTELILNSLSAKEKKEIEIKKQKDYRLKERLETSIISKEDQKLQHFQPLKKFYPSKKIQQTKPGVIYQQKESWNLKEKGLGKLGPLLENPTISAIECPGPEKFIIIKTAMKRTPIKLVLGKDEINNILDYFSQQASIPRIGGVFKAIVNNMIITAIDSEFAGPRFIITKTNPQPSIYLASP